MLGPSCKKPAPRWKRPETPNAVEGLLTAADKIGDGISGGTRHLIFGGTLETRTETPILPKPPFAYRRLSM